eukprot:GHVT01075462.1.p1 GENE.GHVT01075462.1~~GHVT01075462.1.p1  ORF type:complete len:114 (-),score=11.65 GHVT01075462.1:455-796(-)
MSQVLYSDGIGGKTKRKKLEKFETNCHNLYRKIISNFSMRASRRGGRQVLGEPLSGLRPEQRGATHSSEKPLKRTERHAQLRKTIWGERRGMHSRAKLFGKGVGARTAGGNGS